MNADLQAEIDAMITNRIVLYHLGLVKAGQIQDVPNEGPSTILQFSDCSQSERPLQDGQPNLQCEPVE